MMYTDIHIDIYKQYNILMCGLACLIGEVSMGAASLIHQCKARSSESMVDCRDRPLDWHQEMEMHMESTRTITGPNLFLRDLIAVTLDGMQARNLIMSPDHERLVRERAVETHNQIWNEQLAPSRRAAYCARARLELSARARRQNDNNAYLQAARTLQELRLTEATTRDHGVLNQLASVKFDDTDYHQQGEILEDPNTHESAFADIRGFMSPPIAPDEEQQGELNRLAGQLHQPRTPLPKWLSKVVSNRDFCLYDGFSAQVEDDAEVKYELLLWLNNCRDCRRFFVFLYNGFEVLCNHLGLCLVRFTKGFVEYVGLATDI